MAVNAYMADVTHEKNRTMRVAFMSGLFPIGFNIGKGLSGPIKTHLGFMYNFAIGMLLSLFSMLYVLLFVRDSMKIRDKRLRKEREELRKVGGDLGVLANMMGAEEEEKKYTLKEQVKTLFDLTNLKEGYQALIRKRDHNLRLYLWLMIACFELEMFINVGEWSSTYLYLRR